MKKVKSRTDLYNRLAMLFQVGINKNPEGLKVLQSHCAMATSDEPEKETFLEVLIIAIIDVYLEKIPQKKQEGEQERVLLLIHSDAMKELNVSALQWVFAEIKKRLPVVPVIDVEGNALGFSKMKLP